MENLKIIDSTPENIHNFGMCGYKNTKNKGFQLKLEWIKARFAEGMKYKLLISEDGAAIGGIEYLPGEYAWRPVFARGFMFIHCIFIMKKDAKGKGYGQKMVETCIEDAKSRAMNGVAVVTRKGSWMSSPDLFLKMGFTSVDFGRPDFELMALKFNENHSDPSFVKGWEEKLQTYKDGLFIFNSSQCPYSWKAVTEISDAAIKDFKMFPTIIELKSAEDSQKLPFPFGTFGIILNGKVVADHPVSQTRFRNIMKKELGYK